MNPRIPMNQMNPMNPMNPSIRGGKKTKFKGTYIQSVLFDKTKFSTDEARKWLRHHDFEPIKRVHKTDAYLRYRLKKPHSDHRYRVKEIKKGNIRFVIGFPPK